MTWRLRTPVALLTFARPEATQRIVTELLRARPAKVFVIGDGPRGERPGEASLVAATRAVIEEAPWDCEVVTNYSDVNLGTKYRPATGLDWLFEHVEQAIVLEDDCLPHPTFWRFCDELLENYRDDHRVMMISGNNYLGDRYHSADSYSFSHYVGIWGWATWRRAWRHYDPELRRWRELRNGTFLSSVLSDASEIAFWRECFDRVVAGKALTWDHQWQFACWIQNGLSIVPAVNLCTNIGFEPTAQHYRDPRHKLSNFPMTAMQFPLRHPASVIRNGEADDLVFREVITSSTAGLVRRLLLEWLRRLRGTV